LGWLIHLLGLDVVHANDVVGETSKELVTFTRPGKGDALNRHGLGLLGLFRLNKDDVFTDGFTALKIPDADGRGGGGAEPVTDRRKDKSVDDVIGREGGQVAALVEVPEHGLGIFTTGGAQGSIRGHGDGVHVFSVSGEVHAELAGGEVPDLNNLVPSGGDDERDSKVRGESDTADPFLVTIFGDGELQYAQSVPEVDGLIARSRDNLTVVSGEGNREHILGVTNEAAGGLTGLEIPETELTIPRSGEGEHTIRRESDVSDKVTVSSQSALGLSVDTIATIADGPDDDRFVAGSADDAIRDFRDGGNGGDPSAVSFQFTSEYESILGSFHF